MAENEMKETDAVENNAEMINVYLPEYHQNIPARTTESVDDINYKFNLLNGKKPKDFIGMFPFRQPDLSEVKSVVFDHNPKQPEKEEQPYQKNTLDEIGDELIEKRLNQLGGKRRGKNYVAPFFKGAGSALYNIGATIHSGLKYMSEDAGVAIFNAIHDADVDLTAEQQRSIRQYWQTQEEIREKLGLKLGKYDSQFSGDLGGGIASMVVALMSSAAYKSPNAAAMVFGMSKTGDVYARLREKGVSAGEALPVATGAGVVEGGIERIGLPIFLRTYGSAVLKRKGNVIKTILKQGEIEFLQEGSQSLSGNFLMAPYEEGYQWKKWIDDALYEGGLAAVTAPVAGAATYGMTGELRAKYADIYHEKLGLDEQQSKNLAELTVLDREEAIDVITEIADNETIATLFNDNAVNDAEQTLKEGQDILDKLLAQKAMGLSDEVQAKADEFAETMKQQALSAGESEDVADTIGKIPMVLTHNIATAAVEEGLASDVDKAVADLLAGIVGGGNKAVDENLQEVSPDIFALTDPGYDAVDEYMTPEQRQNEIDEERIATMVEDGGMSVEEATFRVKTGREPTELDKALGYDFIQYQIGEALTERENGYKIADDNETVETVVIPDNALPEFKTRADLRNWLIGKFNEIGNVTIKSTGANVEFNKTGAQRAIKNARQKKNNIAYPEIEKVVSGAKYSGFREADERHQNVKGQDVYHSGVVYKGVPYSVEFYVDVPLSGNTGDNFAGNKIREIKIAPTETRVTSENQNRPANNLSDAISNVSLAVLRGKVKPARYDMATETLYQTGEAKDLYATHNMNLAGVKGALKLGGLAMPSLALRKVSQGNINQFGEIVFVANEKLSTPSRGTNVYDRDAWTPSIAYQIKYELLPEANDFIKETLSKVGRERDLSMFVYNINDNITSPRSNDMAIELYAIDKRLDENYNQYEIMNSQEYVEWYEDNLMSHAEPYLLTENSTNTDMVRKKLTLDNIMKVLKKQEKESGGFLGNYPDISNILNYFAYKFKDLKEIRKNKHKLVSKEEQVEAVRELNEKFSNLVEQVATANEQSYFDTLSDVAVTIIDRDTKASEKLKSRGLKGPENLDEIVEDIREDIINIPTDYFEVKPRRIVDFSEFSGVIIPKGKKYDEVADILEKEHFLTVERVEENNEQEYNEALNNIYDAASTTFFQTGEKAVGRRVYSVFDLKVGDHTVIGDVQEIDNENRTIKINDRIYSMLLLDTQIQYKGLVVNDALVGNAEENVSETEQVEKIKKAEENRSAVEEQKRNNREYNQKAKDYFGITNNLDVGGYILTDGDVLDLSGRKFGSDGKSRSIDHREISDAFEDYGVSMEDFINSGNIRYMPESNSILMSDVPTSEQYKVIEKIINRADGEVRVELMNDANNWGSDKDFSREYPAGTTLTKIKRDINAFYRGAGVRDIMQFLQKGTAAGQSRQNRMIYPVMGQYEPAKKLITLFQGKDTTTLCHELLHHYLPIYLHVLEKAGRFDKLEGLYRELGVSRMADMGREEWEKLVDLGTSYIFYNQAPNEASKSIFERAKQWMMDAYNTVKKFVKPSPEVTKFFDGLFARDASTLPDVSDLKGRTAELAKILQGAKNGQELTVNGLSLRDISRLRQALYARVPAAGKTLADEIRSAGGIDTESELARQLGYDSRKGTEGGFWNYKGTIKDESQLIDFLKANGYLEETTENTYEETSSVWDKVQQLINRRNDTYNEKEQSRQMARDSALAAGQVVSEILNQHYIGDVKKLEEDLKAATKMLADRGAAAVDKATLDYLTFSLKQMEKDYQRLLYQKKEERYNYQEKLTKFIKDLPLDYNHKSKFMDKIRMVKDEKSFNKYLKETKERAEKYIEQEQRRMLSNLIQSEVKSSRPRKVMAQKYDYENNVLFKDLRDYNKMTQSEAAAKLEKLDKDEESVDNPGSRGYLLRRMFLEYKANGMDSSSELMRQLYEMIGEAKQLGRESKEESEFEKSFEREQDRQQIIDKLDASKADKNKWTTMATNVYRRGITNLYSMLNSIAGKEIADKYEMETVIDRKEQREWKHLKKTSAKAEVIYKVKSYGDLLNVMADKGQEVAVLYRRQKDDTQEAQTESYNENFKYDVSVLDIIDIYNAIKNKKTRQDYEEAYGAEQINRLISLLSPEDRAFGDMLMEDVNSRFSELNKVYVRTYGMDLKKVDNYWMGSAEHIKPVDIVNDFRQQSTTPGFFKERTAGTVTPVAKNAWIKYQKHISQSYYMTDVAEKYKQLADIFKSTEIQNLIENHYGSGVYNALTKQIENIGLNAQSPRLDDVSGYFQKLLNNWVGAKVSVNPVVFVGQLTSFTNYAEGVNLSAFIKNIGYALAHPIEVKDFMMKYNGDFLQHRYEAGFNEAMSRFIEGAKETNGKKFGLSAKAKFNYSNALSSFVRIGDLGAIIYGGYGQFKTLLDSGMSVEEARRKFEFSTLRSQQSGNAASISDWQQQRGFPRTYLAFKNASLQYTRKIADTVIMLQNGDISREEAAKVLTNYLLIQPAFWVIAKNIAKSLLGLGDDDDEFDDGVLEQLLANPIDGVPFVSDIVRYAYREAAGEKNYSLFSTPLLDDVEKSFRKIGKEDKDFYDFADIVTPFIEMLTSAPAGTAKRYMKIYNEKWGE